MVVEVRCLSLVSNGNDGEKFCVCCWWSGLEVDGQEVDRWERLEILICDWTIASAQQWDNC